MPCGMQDVVPLAGIKFSPYTGEHGVLTIGPLGKSNILYFKS